MVSERQALNDAIDRAAAAIAPPPLLPPPLHFDPETRAGLLHHFTGLVMSARVKHLMTLGGIGYTQYDADQAVNAANETVMALERHYTLALAKVRGNG